jgi:hypothetical protein
VSPTPFEIDLQRFAEDLATRPAQPCLPSTFEAATSATSGVRPPHAERSPHTPRVAHACRAALHSSGRVFGVFQVGGVSDGSKGGPGVAHVLHAPVTERFSSPDSIWASVICVFSHF